MTRVLQIRRGDTAANNNFTGLPGEISFDTDAKTLRVHDGQTLGGFPLARRDQLGGGQACPGFDIDSVPAEFWQNIVKTYGQSALQVKTGRPMSLANVAYMEYVFDGVGIPKIVQADLICQSAEAGYETGDTVSAFGFGARANPAPNAFVDESGLHLRLMLGGESAWVSHNDTGVTTNVTPANWRLVFTVWY